MSNTNTIATYLIILEYINFTKFEIPLSIVSVGHALRALSLLGLVNKRVLRGRIRKDSSPFFFLIFFYLGPWFFLCGVAVWSVIGCCFFRGWGGGGSSGTPWVVNHHYSFLYSKSEAIIWLSNFDVDIYNQMIDSFKLGSASNRTGTFP